MRTWLPESAWTRKKGSVSKQIQIVRRKRRTYVAPGKAAVAQRSELTAHNRLVAGSNPAGGTSPGSSKGRTRGFGP